MIDPIEARLRRWSLREFLTGANFAGIVKGNPLSADSLSAIGKQIPRLAKNVPPIVTIS